MAVNFYKSNLYFGGILSEHKSWGATFDGKSVNFKVWAPNAKPGTMTVQVPLNGKVNLRDYEAEAPEGSVRSIPLTAENNGFFTAKVLLDGKPILPKVIKNKKLYLAFENKETGGRVIKRFKYKWNF